MPAFLSANLAGGQTRFRTGELDSLGAPIFTTRALTPAAYDGDPDATLPPYPAGTLASQQDAAGTAFWMELALSDLGDPSPADMIARHGWEVRSFTARIVFRPSFTQVGDFPALHLPPQFNEESGVFFDLSFGDGPRDTPPNRQLEPGSAFGTESVIDFAGFGPSAAFDGLGDPDADDVVLRCRTSISLGRYIHLINGSAYAPALITFSASLGFLSGDTFTIADGDATGTFTSPEGLDVREPQVWGATTQWRGEDLAALASDLAVGSVSVARSEDPATAYAGATLGGGNARRPAQMMNGRASVDCVWSATWPTRAT